LKTLKAFFPQTFDAPPHQGEIGTGCVDTIDESGGYPLDVRRQPREAGQHHLRVLDSGNVAHSFGDLGRLLFDLPDLRPVLLHEREAN
jgi:hypothetical protein